MANSSSGSTLRLQVSVCLSNWCVTDAGSLKSLPSSICARCFIEMPACRHAGLSMKHRAQILEGKDFKPPASVTHQFDKHTETCNLNVEPDELFAIEGDYYALEAIRYSEQVSAQT